MHHPNPTRAALDLETWAATQAACATLDAAPRTPDVAQAAFTAGTAVGAVLHATATGADDPAGLLPDAWDAVRALDDVARTARQAEPAA